MRYLAAYVNHRAARTAQTARRKRLKGVMQSLKNSYDSLRMICVDEDVWEAMNDIRQAFIRLQNVARRIGIKPTAAPSAIVIDAAPDVLEAEMEKS
jgi:hypothetical protein